MRPMPSAQPLPPLLSLPQPGQAPADPELGLVVTVTDLPADSAGAILCVGVFDSPVGRLVAIGADGVLWGLGLAAAMGEAAVRADLARRWPGARLTEAPKALSPMVAAVLAGRGAVRVRLTGTPFQGRVWRALLSVPAGRVIGYGTLAAAIGQPGAARAVGAAVGRNPVSWAVPCHRVAPASGGIGGYHWGASVKERLLRLEAAAPEDPQDSPGSPLP